MKLNSLWLLLCTALTVCTLSNSAHALVVAPTNPVEEPVAVMHATNERKAVEQIVIAPPKAAPKSLNRLLAIRRTAGEHTALKDHGTVDNISHETSPAVVVERTEPFLRPWMGFAVLVVLAVGLIVAQLKREAARKREHAAKLAAAKERQAPFLKNQ